MHPPFAPGRPKHNGLYQPVLGKPRKRRRDLIVPTVEEALLWRTDVQRLVG